MQEGHFSIEMFRDRLFLGVACLGRNDLDVHIPRTKGRKTLVRVAAKLHFREETIEQVFEFFWFGTCSQF